MAYKIYQNIDISEVKSIFVNGNGTTTFSDLKTLPITGFVLFKNGRLDVQIKTNQEIAYETIAKYWRSWKRKNIRIQNDLVLRGLAEYFGHPSRQDFGVL